MKIDNVINYWVKAMTDMHDNQNGSFMDEASRCHECGMFPPDHDPICPNNPALSQTLPADALKKLEDELRVLEAASEPDFEAIAELLTKIESLRSYI